MPIANRSKLLVLEDSILLGLASNKAAVAIMPALAALPKAQAGCHSCGGRTKAKEAYEKVKRQFRTMSDTQLNKLKALLNSDKLRVHVLDGRHVVAITR